MKGSWSLKDVIDLYCPEMSHAKLERSTDGMAAQRAYLEIIAPETGRARREDLKKKLLDYCERDYPGNGQNYKAFARQLKLIDGSDFGSLRWPNFSTGVLSLTAFTRFRAIASRPL